MTFFDPDDRPTSAEAAQSYGFTTRLERAGFRLVSGATRMLPLETASNLGGTIWRRLAPHLRRHPRTLAHLASALPHTTPQEREAIARDMWESLGRTFAEAFHLDEIAADPSRIDIVLSDEARAVVDAATPCVIVSLHMGNWELGAVTMGRLGISMAGVYQALKNTLVDQDVAALRKAFYPAGLFPKGPETARMLMRRLAEGHSLAVLADTRDSRGIPIDFFGRPAPTNPFPAAVARARGVPLLAGRVVRTGPARFRADLVRVPVQRTDDKTADIAATTQAVHDLFAAWIREVPGQWMWSHRRWG